MAVTYKRGKIVNIVKRYVWKQQMLRAEINDPDFIEMKSNLLGQVQALDLVIKELIKEFAITEDELNK